MMRIDLGLPGAAAVESERNRDITAAQRKERKQTDRWEMDEARLSSTGLSLRGLESRVLNMSDVRTEKVEALRIQIARGTYRVDADDVAEALSRDIFGG